MPAVSQTPPVCVLLTVCRSLYKGGRRFGSWFCLLDFDLSVHYVTTACVLICDWPVGVVSPLASQLIMNSLTANITDIESLFQHYQITL